MHTDCEYEAYGLNAHVFWLKDIRSSLFATKIEPKDTLTVHLRLNDQGALETIDGSVINVREAGQLAGLQKDRIYQMKVKMDIFHDNFNVVMEEEDSEVDIMITEFKVGGESKKLRADSFSRLFCSFLLSKCQPEVSFE